MPKKQTKNKTPHNYYDYLDTATETVSSVKPQNNIKQYENTIGQSKLRRHLPNIPRNTQRNSHHLKRQPNKRIIPALVRRDEHRPRPVPNTSRRHSALQTQENQHLYTRRPVKRRKNLLAHTCNPPAQTTLAQQYTAKNFHLTRVHKSRSSSLTNSQSPQQTWRYY